MPDRPHNSLSASRQLIGWRRHLQHISRMLDLNVLVLMLLTAARPALGQLLEADTARWAFGTAGSLYFSSGNVDRLLLRADVSVKHMASGWGFASEQTYQYGTFGAFRTENDLFSRNFVYLNPDRRIYPFLMLWLERNLRKKINLRYQMGPGLSADIWKAPTHLIKLSLTATWEHSRFDGNDFLFANPQSSSIIETVRLTPRIFGEHRIASGKLRLQYESWFQQSVQDWENRRFHQVVVLQLPLNKSLALRGRMDYLYEQVVLRGVAQGDFHLTAGIQAKW